MAMAAGIPQQSNMQVANIWHTGIGAGSGNDLVPAVYFTGCFFNENPGHD
jgi:hypothetical protein